MPLVLGIDSSTQSTKVEIRDLETGILAGEGRAPHPPTSPPRSEQHPDSWWEALRSAVASALATADPDAVAAVSVAGQQHGAVLVDHEGEVVRPAKLWNDTESAPEARALVERLGAAAWAEATGLVPVASFTISKLAWLAQHEPESLAATARVLLPHDWLTLRLCGRAVTDRGDASGTGYFDPSSGVWREELLEVIAPPPSGTSWQVHLPEVLGPTEIAGELTTGAAGELGLRAGITVAAGTGDNMAAAVGVGLRPSDVAISLGTSGTVYAVCEHPIRDASGAVAGFADATGHFLPLVCTLNATGVTDTFARLLGLDHAALSDAAIGESAGAGGVVLLPYLAGERTPNRPDATGLLTGLRTGTGPAQLARAAFEGVVCGLLDGLDALGAAGVQVDGGRLFLVGGGARSPAYRRILADLAQRQVCIPTGEEHVAIGACVQAASVLSGRSILEVAQSWGLGSGEWIDPDRSVDAAAVRAAYAAVRDRV